MKKVSIVIPTLLNLRPLFSMTKKLLDKLFFKTVGIDECEVILVDDGSSGKFVQFLQKFFPKLKVVRNDKNMGFAKAVNKGIQNSSEDLILLLNNDIEILDSHWLQNLVNGMDYLDLDIASVKQSMLDEKFQYITDANRHRHKEEKCFCYLVGWCLLVKRNVFETVGILPVDFGIGFWEDTAWTYVIRNNYPEFKMGVVDNIYPEQIKHLEHQTFKKENINIQKQYIENREMFLQSVRGERQLELPQLRKES